MNTYLVWIFLTLGIVSVFGQDYNRKSELISRQNELRVEIRELNTLVSEVKSSSRDVLGALEETNLKLKKLEELIKINTDQDLYLTDQIVKIETQISSQQETLTKLKYNYALIITSAYKSRVDQKGWMMVLFSKNIFQAYKRNQYLQQFIRNRRHIKDEIEQRISILEVKNDSLETIKEAKLNLVAAQKLRVQELEDEKKRQNRLLRNFNQRQGHFLNQISQKEQLNSQIESEIRRLVREVSAVKSAEVINLDGEFSSYKGKLPWPIEGGVVTRRFGRQNHPIVPSTIIQNIGITMAAKPNSSVRSIFEGQVASIISFRGSNYSVLIKHGKYITVYKNLVDLKVKKGDYVNAMQIIGNAFTNQLSGRATFQFSLFEDAEPQNPLYWLRSQS
ncbi:MAG: peptidoglycan DD-metalloendopeptidase family protein [Flavobacteriaceae bacterium]|nr:peptidoglycan DD-metalloendopeptidase family protein [Flavobacteriaceae bacterium]